MAQSFGLCKIVKMRFVIILTNTLCIMNPVTYVTERFQFGDNIKSIFYMKTMISPMVACGFGLKWFDAKTGNT
jgi:hypothetical protein